MPIRSPERSISAPLCLPAGLVKHSAQRKAIVTDHFSLTVVGRRSVCVGFFAEHSKVSPGFAEGRGQGQWCFYGLASYSTLGY